MLLRTIIVATSLAAVSAPAVTAAGPGDDRFLPASAALAGAAGPAGPDQGWIVAQGRGRGWEDRDDERGRGRGRGRGARERDDDDRDDGWKKEYKHREKMRREHGYRQVGGPPPWAPAHGYRAKEHRFKYKHRGRERYATVGDTVHLPPSGFGACNREVVGGLLGAAAGGFLGSQIGSGKGKTAAVIGGTILGVLVGGSIGRTMDQVDQNCVGQVLERAPTGRPVVWQNPDAQGQQVQVTPTETYQRSDGRFCREYQTEVVIGGRVQQAYGTACRQPDGSWQKVS